MERVEYTADKVQVLEGLEGVRKRPSMYIGDVSTRGLHQLVFEVIDNSIDEALAGECKNIKVIIYKDNIVEVIDDGRGIPVEIHPVYKKPTLELVMTKLHSGAKFDSSLYKISGGLHGVGLSVVNALSSSLEVEIYRNNKIYYQKYERGIPQGDLIIKGETDKRGMRVKFKPDPTIFEDQNISFDILSQRLRELAFLNKGINISIEDKRNNKAHVFQYEEGIVSFIKYLNKNKNVLHEPIYFIEEKEKITIECAIQYNDTYTETIYSYANTINTEEGGTHVIGLKSALTKLINDYAKKKNLLKTNSTLLGEDIREGLVAVLSVKLPNPQFESQTKIKLTNTKVKSIVEEVVIDKLGNFFDKNVSTFKKILAKCMLSLEAREAAKRARELERKKHELVSATLAGKLADCSLKQPKLCELFLVEGDSAGGSAKQARDRRYQAILPLRGKVLNVEKARLDKVLSNEEIKAIVSSLGTGIGKDEFKINKLRYHKIIIMTDADVDGAHIRTLLLTFFYRYMQDLIKNGHIYIAQPPLYCIRTNKKEHYAYTEEEKEEILKKIKKDGKETQVFIQRYKGLGEMNSDQLWHTTMNPASRILRQVKLEDTVEADQIFTVLMGEDVQERRNFIMQYAEEVKNLDI